MYVILEYMIIEHNNVISLCKCFVCRYTTQLQSKKRAGMLKQDCEYVVCTVLYTGDDTLTLLNM